MNKSIFERHRVSTPVQHAPWGEETYCDREEYAHVHANCEDWAMRDESENEPAALFHAIKAFSAVDAGYKSLNNMLGICKKQEFVVLERSQLETLVSHISSLVSRIIALEEKAEIRLENTKPCHQVPEEIASTVTGLAREVFETDYAKIESAQSDGESCLFIIAHVGSDAIPEEMSRKKTELHRRLLKEPKTSTQNIRIKVVYE